MSGPNIELHLVNPGDLAPSGISSQVPFYFGVCSSGTVGQVYRFGNPTDMRETLGVGHLVDVLADAFRSGVRDIRCMRLAVVDAGTAEVTDTDATLTIDSITGTPLHFVEGNFKITNDGGAISTGTRTGQYSLDVYGVDGVTEQYSADVKIPANGQVPISALGLVLHVNTVQDPAEGAGCPFSVTPGHYDAAGVTATLAALKTPLAAGYTYLVFTGEAATAAGANTIGLAINSLVSELYNAGYYCGALHGTGLESLATAVAAFANNVANPPFVSWGHGADYVTAPYSEQGRGQYALRQFEVAARRIARIAVSTDPGRVASGALENVNGISYDAAIEGDTAHDNRISVGRNWEPRRRGFFIQRQRLADQVGGNFFAWPHAAVMIEALLAVDRSMTDVVLETLGRTAAGTIDPGDAKDLELSALKEIDAKLSAPGNFDVRGRPGHISARSVTVSRTVVLPALRFDVRIRPKDYPTDIDAFIMYADQV